MSKSSKNTNIVFPPTELKLGLYPIVDSIQWIELLLAKGVRTIQLRIKNQQGLSLEKTIYDAINLSKKYNNIRLFINDYWQLAIKHNAYGVHLGQEDITFANLEAIHRAGLRLGLSTHNEIELNRALALYPSYIALGHIFPTKTKYMTSTPQGIEKLKAHLLRLQNIPTIAIGGITLSNAPAVLDTGVGGIAVISAITQAVNWSEATHQLLYLVKQQSQK